MTDWGRNRWAHNWWTDHGCTWQDPQASGGGSSTSVPQHVTLATERDDGNMAKILREVTVMKAHYIKLNHTIDDMNKEYKTGIDDMTYLAQTSFREFLKQECDSFPIFLDIKKMLLEREQWEKKQDDKMEARTMQLSELLAEFRLLNGADEKGSQKAGALTTQRHKQQRSSWSRKTASKQTLTKTQSKVKWNTKEIRQPKIE